MTVLIRHGLTVRFRDCDPFGHVNNAVYLTYLEQARFALWRAQLGFVAHRPRVAGESGFILARAEVDYRAQVRAGDDLEISVSLERVGRTSFTYAYEVLDASTSTVVANAKTVIVRYDYNAGRSVPIDDAFRALISAPVVVGT